MIDSSKWTWRSLSHSVVVSVISSIIEIISLGQWSWMIVKHQINQNSINLPIENQFNFWQCKTRKFWKENVRPSQQLNCSTIEHFLSEKFIDCSKCLTIISQDDNKTANTYECTRVHICARALPMAFNIPIIVCLEILFAFPYEKKI